VNVEIGAMLKFDDKSLTLCAQETSSTRCNPYEFEVYKDSINRRCASPFIIGLNLIYLKSVLL